eukprot:gene11962-12105_t
MASCLTSSLVPYTVYEALHEETVQIPQTVPVCSVRDNFARLVKLMPGSIVPCDKPNPRVAPPNSIYNFDTWGQQLVDFTEQVITAPTYISCNSRGLVAAFQRLLRETSLGAAFFSSVATPRTVKNILCQAYANDAAVTDELVQAILQPGLQPGALDVFLDFICYSGGPLPEQLLQQVPAGIPVSILWGADDPWEDMREARRLFAHQPCVTEFVELPKIGHCPQDEAPDVARLRLG